MAEHGAAPVAQWRLSAGRVRRCFAHARLARRQCRSSRLAGVARRGLKKLRLRPHGRAGLPPGVRCGVSPRRSVSRIFPAPVGAQRPPQGWRTRCPLPDADRRGRRRSRWRAALLRGLARRRDRLPPAGATASPMPCSCTCCDTFARRPVAVRSARSCPRTGVDAGKRRQRLPTGWRDRNDHDRAVAAKVRQAMGMIGHRLGSPVAWRIRAQRRRQGD